MLQIKNLDVYIEDRKIINNISLDINVKKGSFFVLLGPNGSGKSSLFRSIMGFSKYRTNGKIMLDGEDISNLSIDERVKKGITYMYQTPPKIKGVKLGDIMKEISSELDNEDPLSISSFYYRDINEGLSGGEMKRTELHTISKLEDTKVFLFDEPDSGVDVDNLKKIGIYINRIVKEKNAIGIIVTHTGDILKHLDIEKAAVIYDGHIACQGNPKKILDCIKKDGYQSCIKCNGKKI